MTPVRYAVYYVPPQDAPWARWAMGWLGWDMTSGAGLPHPKADELAVAEITATPRKYGLHATLKPPFRLADGETRDSLDAAVAALVARHAPVRLDGLAVGRMGGFLGLLAQGNPAALNALADACVRDLDRFRAPLTKAELARRRANGLSPEQEANLAAWGYPHVCDLFRFHITLTGRLDRATAAAVAALLDRDLAPLLPHPFVLNDIALCAEDATGRFQLLHRYALSG